MRIAFTTNLCPHYRVQTFETLARYHDVDFLFFSRGDWFWPREHGLRQGHFRHTYLPGFNLGHTRIAPTLPWRLWAGGYDVYLSGLAGRYALLVARLVAWLRRKPFVLWTGVWQRHDTRAHRLFYPVTRWLYRSADAIVVYGSHVKRFLVDEGVSAERVFVAPHALDNDIFSRSVSAEERQQIRDRIGLSPDERALLFVGRLEEEKGLEYLLEAFARLPHRDVVLVLAGSGSLREALESRARTLGIADRVRFTGYVKNEETTPLYSLAWAFVFPSVMTRFHREAWGLVVNEAFNQGVPAVVTSTVGAAAGGFVRDGQNGLVIPERSSEALHEALIRMIDEKGLRERLGRQALEDVRAQTNERMVRGFRSAIDFVTGHGAPATTDLQAYE